MNFAVITTVQAPTPSVGALVECARLNSMEVIAVGDRKTPSAAWPEGSRFLSVAEQLTMPFDLASRLPLDHYARKNLGYLQAIAQGASLIFDTDDDNAPLTNWRLRSTLVRARQVRSAGWVNAYGYFSEERIWPRGFPLQAWRGGADETLPIETVCSPIQQGLVNGSPDVDAVWRLLFDRDFAFDKSGSIHLAPGSWCPFNSQSTWWFPDAYPLLYLPSTVSFRMTDIWRSFVAQRCLWELGLGVVFHAAESLQDRNSHDLLRDFEQEIPGYLHNAQIAATLERAQLATGTGAVADNLLVCYEALVRTDLVDRSELALIEAWLVDVSRLAGGKKSIVQAWA